MEAAKIKWREIPTSNVVLLNCTRHVTEMKKIFSWSLALSGTCSKVRRWFRVHFPSFRVLEPAHVQSLLRKNELSRLVQTPYLCIMTVMWWSQFRKSFNHVVNFWEEIFTGIGHMLSCVRCDSLCVDRGQTANCTGVAAVALPLAWEKKGNFSATAYVSCLTGAPLPSCLFVTV